MWKHVRFEIPYEFIVPMDGCVPGVICHMSAGKKSDGDY